MRIELTQTQSTNYACTAAILVYTNGGREALAVEHRVVADRGGMRLSAGHLVTRSFVRALMTSIESSTLSYVEPSTIAVGRQAIAWFEPASTRTMFFSHTQDAAVLAFDGAPVPQPPLVFVATARSLRVYAVASDARPTLETPLCRAPYWNVYDDHRVCLGSMAIPASVAVEATPEWTRAFFASSFTHPSGRKAWARPGTYAELLAAATAAGRFEPSWLQPSDTTVREALCSR